MPVNQAYDRLRVAGAQGLEDLLVLGEGLGDAVRVGVHDGDTHPELAVAELVVKPVQDLVATAAHDLGVEAAVGDGGAGQIPGGGLFLLPREQFFEARDELRGSGYGLAG